MAGPLATIRACALPSVELVQNLEEHAQHVRGAFAANTERARRADMLVFSGWCADAGLDPLPATPDTVVAFVDAIAGASASRAAQPRPLGRDARPRRLSHCA